MKKYSTILLLLLIGHFSNAQFNPISAGGSATSESQFQGAVTGKKGIANANFYDTTAANVDPNIKLRQGIQITTVGGVLWVRDTVCKCWVRGGGGGGLIPAGPITTIPIVGTNPGINLSSDSFIIKTFYGTQPPLATLIGGLTLELTSASTVSRTLNWSASRQSATKPLSSIVVAGITQSFSQPGQPGTINGTQVVSVPANITTTYTNTVTTTDGKIGSATLVVDFKGQRYWFYSSNATPTSSDVVADLGGDTEFSTTRVKATQFIVNVTGTNKYVSYAYPSSFGALTSIIISGLESIGAFNQTTVAVTNASGYVQNYYIYTTQNIFQNTSITFISTQ